VALFRRLCYRDAMKREQAITILRANRDALAAAGVLHAYLFGSVARDEAGSESDIDIMIDVAREPFTLFDKLRVKDRLENLFCRDVDVIIRADVLEPGKKLSRVASEEAINVF
jgi:hypothetical protein